MNKQDYKRIDHLLRTWRSRNVSYERQNDAKLDLNDYPDYWISQVRQGHFSPSSARAFNHFVDLWVGSWRRFGIVRRTHIENLYSNCKRYGVMPDSGYLAAAANWSK